MNLTTVKIGAKGFKSYYLPIAEFLSKGRRIKIAALGKRVQMATYLSSIIQKHGARIDNIKISTVELPENDRKTKKPIDVVMIEIFLSKGKFVSQIVNEVENTGKNN